MGITPDLSSQPYEPAFSPLDSIQWGSPWPVQPALWASIQSTWQYTVGITLTCPASPMGQHSAHLTVYSGYHPWPVRPALWASIQPTWQYTVGITPDLSSQPYEPAFSPLDNIQWGSPLTCPASPMSQHSAHLTVYSGDHPWPVQPALWASIHLTWQYTVGITPDLSSQPYEPAFSSLDSIQWGSPLTCPASPMSQHSAHLTVYSGDHPWPVQPALWASIQPTWQYTVGITPDLSSRPYEPAFSPLDSIQWGSPLTWPASPMSQHSVHLTVYSGDHPWPVQPALWASIRLTWQYRVGITPGLSSQPYESAFSSLDSIEWGSPLTCPASPMSQHSVHLTVYSGDHPWPVQPALWASIQSTWQYTVGITLTCPASPMSQHSVHLTVYSGDHPWPVQPALWASIQSTWQYTVGITLTCPASPMSQHSVHLTVYSGDHPDLSSQPYGPAFSPLDSIQWISPLTCPASPMSQHSAHLTVYSWDHPWPVQSALWASIQPTWQYTVEITPDLSSQPYEPAFSPLDSIQWGSPLTCPASPLSQHSSHLTVYSGDHPWPVQAALWASIQLTWQYTVGITPDLSSQPYEPAFSSLDSIQWGSPLTCPASPMSQHSAHLTVYSGDHPWPVQPALWASIQSTWQYTVGITPDLTSQPYEPAFSPLDSIQWGSPLTWPASPMSQHSVHLTVYSGDHPWPVQPALWASIQSTWQYTVGITPDLSSRPYEPAFSPLDSIQWGSPWPVQPALWASIQSTWQYTVGITLTCQASPMGQHSAHLTVYSGYHPWPVRPALWASIQPTWQYTVGITPDLSSQPYEPAFSPLDSIQWGSPLTCPASPLSQHSSHLTVYSGDHPWPVQPALWASIQLTWQYTVGITPDLSSQPYEPAFSSLDSIQWGSPLTCPASPMSQHSAHLTVYSGDHPWPVQPALWASIQSTWQYTVGITPDLTSQPYEPAFSPLDRIQWGSPLTWPASPMSQHSVHLTVYSGDHPWPVQPALWASIHLTWQYTVGITPGLSSQPYESAFSTLDSIEWGSPLTCPASPMSQHSVHLTVYSGDHPWPVQPALWASIQSTWQYTVGITLTCPASPMSQHSVHLTVYSGDHPDLSSQPYGPAFSPLDSIQWISPLTCPASPMSQHSAHLTVYSWDHPWPVQSALWASIQPTWQYTVGITQALERDMIAVCITLCMGTDEAGQLGIRETGWKLHQVAMWYNEIAA